jgi:hypothetical protein
VLPVAAGQRLGPAGVVEASVEVVDDRLGDVDSIRARRHGNALWFLLPE